VATKVVENYFAPALKGTKEDGDDELSTINYQLSTHLRDLSNPNDLHEAKLLMLDISKAKFQLGWEPRLNIDQTVELTVDWYKRYKSKNIHNLCVENIVKYLSNKI